MHKLHVVPRPCCARESVQVADLNESTELAAGRPAVKGTVPKSSGWSFDVSLQN